MTLTAKPVFYDYFLLVMLAAIFGSSFMLIGVIVTEMPSLTLVVARLAIAAVIFLVAMVWVGQRLPPFGRIWIFIIGAAICGNALPFFLISWGQERVDAGLAAIFMACMPLITIVMAHFFTNNEKLTVYKVIGFCFGFVGVVLMIGFDKLGNLGDETLRQYAIILAAASYAINAIVSKSLVKVPRLAMMAALMLVSILLVFPFGLMNSEFSQVLSAPLPSFKVLISLIALGVLPTAIGTIMIFMIISRNNASFLSQINFMVPLFGVFWSMIFLSEVLPPNAIAALVLILAGVAIARIQPKIKSISKAKAIEAKEL